jgi:hypothetical protein
VTELAIWRCQKFENQTGKWWTVLFRDI